MSVLIFFCSSFDRFPKVRHAATVLLACQYVLSRLVCLSHKTKAWSLTGHCLTMLLWSNHVLNFYRKNHDKTDHATMANKPWVVVDSSSTHRLLSACYVVSGSVSSALHHAGMLTTAQKRGLRHVLTRPHKHKDRRGRPRCRQATIVDTSSLPPVSQLLDSRNGTGQSLCVFLSPSHPDISEIGDCCCIAPPPATQRAPLEPN